MRLNRHPGLKAQVYVACDKTKTMESKNLLQFPENCMHTAFAQHSKGIPRFSVRGSAAWGACQLCTLPLGHLCQCHQMTLLLPNVVLSGKFPFLMFLSWSHCSSKACFAPAKVGRFCLVPSAFLPAFAFAHLGHPVLHVSYSRLEPAICASKRCTCNGPACCWRQSLGLEVLNNSSLHPKTVQLPVPSWQACCADKWPCLSRKDSLSHGSCCAHRLPKHVEDPLGIGRMTTTP